MTKDGGAANFLTSIEREPGTCCRCGVDLDETRVFGSCRPCSESWSAYWRETRARGRAAAKAALLPTHTTPEVRK